MNVLKALWANSLVRFLFLVAACAFWSLVLVVGVRLLEDFGVPMWLTLGIVWVFGMIAAYRFYCGIFTSEPSARYHSPFLPHSPPSPE